jgi:hypothetical protein
MVVRDYQYVLVGVRPFLFIVFIHLLSWI